MTVARQTYHHGDLRRTLVEAAETLLEERGAAGLSLREVAKRAGVSHAAPYRHFHDKAALLDAIAQAGFERLSSRLREAHDRNPRDHEAQLKDAGLAYVGWATERPERTRLMLGGMMKEDPLCTCLHAAAEDAFGWIFRIIDGGRAAGVFGGPDTHSVVISAWSAVHGLAMLILNSGKLHARGPAEVRHLAEVVCETIADGIRARPERPRLDAGSDARATERNERQ
jgi:AcrR family transcriptional regulator